MLDWWLKDSQMNITNQHIVGPILTLYFKDLNTDMGEKLEAMRYANKLFV